MYKNYVKRILDLILSFFALILFSPLLLILSVIGTVLMKGNPFFTQLRPGKTDGKLKRERIFRIIKFRTMTDEKDENGVLLPDNERLNGYGKFLRKTSLDELPELINILKGDMAIVGPRPLLVKYLPLYSEEQRHRHDVRPGLTGYAQVHGRNSLSWENKFAMDVWYTGNVTFRNDIKIITETFTAVIGHKGINSGTSATMEEFTGSTEKSKVTWEAPL